MEFTKCLDQVFINYSLLPIVFVLFFFFWTCFTVLELLACIKQVIATFKKYSYCNHLPHWSDLDLLFTFLDRFWLVFSQFQLDPKSWCSFDNRWCSGVRHPAKFLTSTMQWLTTWMRMLTSHSFTAPRYCETFVCRFMSEGFGSWSPFGPNNNATSSKSVWHGRWIMDLV